MHITKITWRHRNDFHFIAECEHCGAEGRYRDGYADKLYCLRIIPARPCPECGLNSYGLKDGAAPKIDHD